MSMHKKNKDKLQGGMILGTTLFPSLLTLTPRSGTSVLQLHTLSRPEDHQRPPNGHLLHSLLL